MAPFFNKLKFFENLIQVSEQKVANGKFFNLFHPTLECYSALGYEFFKKGENICSFNEHGSKFYIIIKGKISFSGK